jgi:hypothetical protein
VRLLRVRLTVRKTMALVAIVGLMLGWVASRERLRRQTSRVINQDITVGGAEANYRNAGLAREATEAAIVRYIGERGAEDESPTLTSLKTAARSARQRELYLEEVWKQEKETLSRLIRELSQSWH